MSGIDSSELGSGMDFEAGFDFYELLLRINHRRNWVGLCAILFAVVGGIYAYWVYVPLYKAEIYLMPVKESNLQALNAYSNSDLSLKSAGEKALLFEPRLTADREYAEFILRLQSKSQMLAFIRASGLDGRFSDGGEAQDEEMLLSFGRKIQVLNRKDQLTVVSLKDGSAESAAELLESYIDFVHQQLVKDKIEELYNARDGKRDLLLKEIQAKRKVARLKRDDRVKQLQEALEIVVLVGGENIPADLKIRGVEDSLNNMIFRGESLLKAEVDVLKARSTDDHFIDGLRELQKGVEYLNSVDVKAESLQLVAIDLHALIPQKLEKPNRIQLAAGFIILGAMVGLFGAIVMPFRRDGQIEEK